MRKRNLKPRRTFVCCKTCLSICLLFLGIGITNANPDTQSTNENQVAQQQSIHVSGIVTDAEGLPLIGVSVANSSRSVGTVTDIDGRYSLNLPSGITEIQFSYIGFVTQRVRIGNRSVINVTLEEDVHVLDDLVVVGYGTQKKETVTGAVAAVTTKDLLQSPQANISNALAGRMPGLLSVQRSGEPGKDASTLRIRGVGTFAEGQDPLVMVDGIESDNYNNIDPNEIESLTILKDASATAVYGVRGANGVIIITTKRGLSGKPQLSLTTNAGVSSFPFLRKNMNSYEFASAYNQAERNDSFVTGNFTQMYSPEQIEAYRTNSNPILYPSVDWYDYLLKDYALQSQSNLNIRGGTDKVRYFTSLGFFTQDGMLNTGIVDTSYDSQISYKRYNIRSNFDIDITKNLLLSLDISTQIGEIRGPNWDTGSFMEMLSSVRPNAAPGIVDGKITTISTIPGGGGTTPITPFTKGWHQDYENNLNGSIRLNYKMDYLLKGLSLRGAVSYRNFNTEVKRFETDEITYDARPAIGGGLVYLPNGDPSQMRYGNSISRNRRIYAEVGANYARTFGVHSVTGLVLYNQSKYYSPDLAFLIPNGYQGIVGRATYNYDNKYLAEFNVGYNGTENFAVGKRFGVFPAYSLGWVITEEKFIPKNNYLTFAKLRASYGVVGNDKIGGDRFLYRPTSYTYSDGNKPVYYFGEIASSNGYGGSAEGKLGNPDLTWERAKKTNFGADMKFLEDKLGLTIEYFKEDRNNILWNRETTPEITGLNMPAYNLGIMKNSGYEGEISYYDGIGKNFRYYVKANYTYAHNEIVFRDEVPQQYAYRYRTGQRFGQFFGYVADGIYNTWEEVNDPNRPIYMWSTNKIQPGDIKYKDINGDGHINDDDQVPIGYSNFPEVMFGFTLGGSYKDFDFSLLFQGATNVSNLPSRRTMRGFYTHTGANKDLLKSWSQERYDQGLDIRYPRYSVTEDDHNYQTSTFWLEDASYLRLKNMEIGYTMKFDFLKKMGISSTRIYINGNNLLTWSRLRFPGQDPEYPTGEANNEPYPVTRVYNIGLNVNF